MTTSDGRRAPSTQRARTPSSPVLAAGVGEARAGGPREFGHEIPPWRRGADRIASRVIDATVATLLRWWPALAALGAGGLVLGAYLVPVLMHLGYAGWGRALFEFYSALCAQTPEHSYFLWGHQAGIDQRLTALYGTAALSALLYQPRRSRGGRTRALRWRFFLLLSLPIVLDGVTQMPGWRQSTWELRTITGALFGTASVWALFPRLDAALREFSGVAP